MPPFKGWTLEDFWQRQLADVLIVEFSVPFQQQISPKAFFGEVTFARSWSQPAGPTTPPLVAIETNCTFWDDTGGSCQGRALLAITNPPVVEA